MPEDALSIGEVINLLRDDFPDVSVSKIRFLESQGLIDPDRTNSGYRQFSTHDVARLRFILQQQRDHFLPLKVIKSKLTLWERGESQETSDTTETDLNEVGEPIERSDLLKRSRLRDDELDALQSFGLISAVGDTGVFPAEAAIIATEAKRLIDLGLEPRHLRTVQLAAQRESDLLTQLVAPLLRASNPEARSQARDVMANAAESVAAIHRAQLTIHLREQLSP